MDMNKWSMIAAVGLAVEESATDSAGFRGHGFASEIASAVEAPAASGAADVAVSVASASARGGASEEAVGAALAAAAKGLVELLRLRTFSGGGQPQAVRAPPPPQPPRARCR